MRYLSFFCLLFLSGLCFASEIKVSSQEEFDDLGKFILREISRGEENIHVDIMPGHYFFEEGHITLMGLRANNVHLSFNGHGAIISARGEKGTFSLDAGYIGLREMTDVPFFKALKFGLSQAELLDAQTGLWRLAAEEKPVKASKASDMFILITQMYCARYYRVEKIEDGNIYFYAPGTEDSINPDNSPNSDFRYGHMSPRYALVNSPYTGELYVKKNGRIRYPSRRGVVRCDAVCFLKVRGGSIGSVSMDGIRFLGAAAGDYPLIDIYRVKVGEKISLSNCSFDGIRGDVLRITASNSVSFFNNTVQNCYRDVVSADSESEDIIIKGNKFLNTGLRMGNYFAVRCRAYNFLIADNYFENFVYGAIGVGLWFKTPPPHNCVGIVENNECWLTPGYGTGVPFNLMDSGAIYTWTINKDVTIRNNYIHDISGPRDNRGIFCDDGTVNVKLIGNRVERISNSFCIDLRRVLSVETIPGSRIKTVNVGNVLKDNIVDGKIRFEERDK